MASGTPASAPAWPRGSPARAAPRALHALLLGLDSPPERLDFVRSEIAGVAEHVGMAADELGGDRLDDAAEIEQPRLLRHAGVKDDLQQQIAELVAQIRDLAALDRVGDLIGFLDRDRGRSTRRSARGPTDSRPRDRAAPP